MVGRKGGGRVGADDGEEELARIPLQAILLADSFTTKFRPITLERPKVLLPLVNVPMIDYTLAWLESAGVEEVFVFCCAHSKQVIDHLDNSKWFEQPNFVVTPIESHNAISAGDALRLVYDQNVIHGDFVLVSGDTVSNMSLTEALKEHKERRLKDSKAVMTMVIKQSKPSPITHQSRLGTEELFIAIEPDSKQLLYYEDKCDDSKGCLSLEKELLADNPSISLHNDKQDCYVDICSPEVLSLFTDNFDYQHLRRHFVKGLLLDDIMGYKIFTHEIQSSYAARIDNFKSYDTVSKDIIQRWTYPLVPDVQFFRSSVAKLGRRGVYRASEVKQSCSAKIGPFTVIGNNTTIGKNSEISNSVVGEGCIVGSHVRIDGCYIWNNVTIEDGCRLKHAIVCDGVIIKSMGVLDPGAVVSFKVLVGEHFHVPAYSKVSLLPQPMKQDSDEELEYADNNSAISSTSDKLNEDTSTEPLNAQQCATYQVGDGAFGYIWSISESELEDDWKHSVAPIPADKLVGITHNLIDELDVSNQEGNALPTSGELEPDSDTDGSIDEAEDIRNESMFFEKEVEATFRRAVEENVKHDHVVLEVNALRLSSNMASEDCAGALFYSMMKLSLDTPHSSSIELVKNAGIVFNKWKKLLKYYLPSIDEEIEVIIKLEEFCSESIKEYSHVFVEILHVLYDQDIIPEEAILKWASEREEADESDKFYVKQAEKLIQWLREASEEED
ncbi:unnamed protein product [Cuscuta epithymum]|uniref:Translation initiation factor eIF2B subunit epsilon n=1 Tax=Cuscuta epithymum TaxID=186058 RepID=A0AAV0DGA1_9ASTE|nr:unnamed protein product [Cuscuta epithymum]